MNKKSGFTVVEVIVAIVVLSLALLSGFRLLSTFITTTANNRDRLTATYLAQECLEEARNLRDSNWQQFKPWDEGLGAYTDGFKKFTIKQKAITNEDENLEVEINDDVKLNLPQSKTITCTVTWHEETQFIEMQSILTNWRNN